MRTKKLIRWGTGTILVLGTFIGLFYAEENWRGAHAWKKVEAELQAEGEPLTMKEVIPPEVPDGLNTAMAPVWKEIFTEDESKKENRDVPAARIKELSFFQAAKTPSIKKGGVLDLKVWANNLGLMAKGETDQETLDKLLSLFSERKELAAEISESLRRPYKRWPLRYEDGFSTALPFIEPTLNAAHFYQLRGILGLAQGNDKQAYDDLESIWLLTDCYRPEIYFINSLVEMTLQGMAWPIVWEGLAQHKWSPGRLEQIKKVLLEQEKRDLISPGLRGERVVFLSSIVGLSPKELMMLTNFSDAAPSPWPEKLLFETYRLRPQGWLDRDKVLYATTMQKQIEWYEDLMRQGRIPVGFSGMKTDFGLDSQSEWQRFQMPLSALSLPTFGAASKKFAELTAYQRMIITACAIEQYRLADGAIPASLEELVPTYLDSIPLDTMNGQPLKYLVKGGNDYLLYSVGLNGTDEGGKNSKDREGGDWVWPSRPGLIETLDK